MTIDTVHRLRGALMLASVLPLASAVAQVRVINAIPVMFGDETTANPEPTLAVNPASPLLLAISSFLMGTNVCAGSARSPILLSHDGGSNWSAMCKMSTPGLGATPPGDVVLRWSPDGRRLYAAFIWPYDGTLHTRVVSTDDVFSPDTMRVLIQRDFIDQPELLVLAGPSGDRVLFAGSFKDINFGQANVVRVDQSARGGSGLRFPIEFRKTWGANYSVRMAAHASGRVYAVYNGASSFAINGRDSSVNVLDITVVRDDSSAGTMAPFTALRESIVTRADTACTSGDGAIGVRVARCRAHPNVASLGVQRLAPVMLSIAADPSNARGDRVFVAWCDSTRIGTAATARVTAHVARSDDGGATWRELIAMPNAINPALAVDGAGRLGVLVQQFGGDSVDPRWVTRLLIGEGGELTKPREYVLARTSANPMLYRFQPYIGDYAELHVQGESFVGVFSAANHPNPLNFPNGVTYQRTMDSTLVVLLKRDLLNIPADPIGQVAPSIDPFFFSVQSVWESFACGALRATLATEPPTRRDPAQLPQQAATQTQRQMATLGCKWP